MRFSVLAYEALAWWSAVVAWLVYEGQKNGRSWRSQVGLTCLDMIICLYATQMTGIMTVLFQPSLMLIDNGHFQ